MAVTHYTEHGSRTGCGRTMEGVSFLDLNSMEMQEPKNPVAKARATKDWKHVSCRNCAKARPRLNGFQQTERIRKETRRAWDLIDSALRAACGRFAEVRDTVLHGNDPGPARDRAVAILDRANTPDGTNGVSRTSDALLIRKLLGTGATLTLDLITRATGIPRYSATTAIEHSGIPSYQHGKQVRYYDRRAYFSAGGQITNPRDGQTAGE